MDVLQLQSRTDFRLEKLAGQKVWYVPADDDAAQALDQAWRRLVGSSSGMPQELSIKGRRLRVPRAAMGVARFFFHDLCEQPLAASDYLRVAHEFHTVIVDRILAPAQRPAAALSEIARTLKSGGRAVVIEDFDVLSAVGAANPIATLREWFARAGLECERVHPVDTENAHLLIALARRPVVDTRQSA